MRWSVSLDRGEVPILADDDKSQTTVILAHGAGSHMEHKTLDWLASLVRASGSRIVRFNFLYRAQSRSMPDRMPVLIETYREVIESVRQQLKPGNLIIGGHSMGGRVATMLEAERHTADGLLLFAYPLHPPGQPEKLRDQHLPMIEVPTLQFSGTEDEFCTKELMERIPLDPKLWSICWLQDADHSYSVRKSSGRSRKDVETEIRGALAEWLPRLAISPG
jgi:uncharacterized protein